MQASYGLRVAEGGRGSKEPLQRKALLQCWCLQALEFLESWQAN